MNLDDQIRARMVQVTSPTEEVIPEPTVVVPVQSDLQNKSANVMASYQNANKWLDIIKESLLMDQGCVFFSNYVHNLAHSMPVRFDAFGDILHTIDMKVPYPATEYIEKEPENVPEAFDEIEKILHCICDSLAEFIDLADGMHMRAVAISTENLLSDISTEFTNLSRMKRAYAQSNGDIIKFDKWVAQYVNNIGTLID